MGEERGGQRVLPEPKQLRVGWLLDAGRWLLAAGCCCSFLFQFSLLFFCLETIRTFSIRTHGRVATAANLPHEACLINPPHVSPETFATAAPPATVLGRDLPVWDPHKGLGPPPSCFIVVREVEKRFSLLDLDEHSVAL